MKTKRIYEELKGTEKECFDLLHNNQKAIDSNTEWVIEFYAIKTLGYFGDDLPKIMRAYPPESLTKYRRNLIFDGLIHPSEKSKEHSLKMEAKNHRPKYQHQAENEWDYVFKKNNALNI